MAFTWDDSYSVGVREMDEDHQRIIRMIAELQEAKDAEVSSEVVSELLTKMTQYASEHFRREETLLEKYNYPRYSEQKSAHREYRKRTVALCTDTMRRKVSVPEELLQFLETWWKDHILREDMQYRSFLNENGID